MKQHFLLIVLFLLTAFGSRSQEIDSLKIIPVSPTSSENIQVIAFTEHPNMNCDLFNSTVNTSNDTVYIAAFHAIGMLPALCNSIDTITIGNLMSGNYVLIYNVTDTIFPYPGDTDTLLFSVQGFLETKDHIINELLIYPNPVTEYIQFGLDQGLPINGAIDIYSAVGEKIISTSLTYNDPTLYIGHLKAGVYFIHYTSKNSKKVKRIIKQ